MAAPYGNKNPEKWTKASAVKFFEDSLETLKKKPHIKFIGSLAVELGFYRQLYEYLPRKWPDEIVFDIIKKQIDGILEGRQVSGAMDNDLNTTMVIFTLKNHHGWEDKRVHAGDKESPIQTENKNTNTDIDFNSLPDELQAQILAIKLADDNNK